MWNHPSCLRGWSVFSESIKDGRSGIEHAFGKRLYEHLAETPGATKAFSDAMVSNSAHTSGSIARQFPFQDYELIMDLGGGVGTLLCAILQEHPHLRGVIYEIEELLQPAQYNIDSCNLTGRARTEAGNFLKKVPPGPDLYMIKNSLWNWQDDDCRHILSNVREASQASKGQLLIIEYVIDNENAPWSTLYDLQILNMPGGRARTMSEYEKLLCQSGFAIDSVELVEDQTLVLCVPV